MTKQTIIEEITKILAKQLRIDPATISESSSIVEDLGADSIDLVEMLMSIEEKLGIVVSDEDAIKLKTVGDVADFIASVTK